jgi:hypothetical protein
VAQPAPSYLPDPAKVRAQLAVLLARAKAAPATPFRAADQALYRVVFPQMTNWLPEDEARRLRADFAAELERLRAAAT